MTILTANNVSKIFGAKKAVDSVSLDVHPGEILGLIGANGAGKTTFFNCLTGAYKIDGGEICFEGKRINGLKPYEICRLGIARTFQIVKPFSGLSVIENVMTGAFCRFNKYENARDFSEKCLQFVGIYDKKELSASELNTGDQRKLELARALATKPTLLLLDEVMAGLTPTESENVKEIIRKIKSSGVTIIMIEHIMSALMQLSDRVVVLDSGRIICEGTPEEVSKNDLVIEIYLGKDDDTDA